jgi:hypothetical protein
MTETPQLTYEQAAEIAQEHEDFLNQLESRAISAIALASKAKRRSHQATGLKFTTTSSFTHLNHDITPCSQTGDIS